MTSRDRLVWAVAIAVSLAVHGGVLWQHDRVLSAEPGKAEKQAGVTRLSFGAVAQAQPVPVPEDKPQPKPQPKPKPQPQPKPKPPPKPAAQTEPSPQPEPVAEEVPAAEPTPPPAAANPGGEARATEQARQNYLGVLMAHIEKNKYYPSVARRRGMEGMVRVSFMVQASGEVVNLRVEKGPDLLRRAAEQAVLASVPLPAPPPSVSSPLTVGYEMEFRLR